MRVYTHHRGPERLVGFVTLADSTFYNGEPKWFGPDTVDSLDQKGSWEESSVLPEWRPRRTKETGGKPRTSIADVMMPRWCKGVE